MFIASARFHPSRRVACLRALYLLGIACLISSGLAIAETDSMQGHRVTQSPMLDLRVEVGALPPLEQRLPEQPQYVAVESTVGTYGGTAHIFALDLDVFVGVENPITMAADISTLLPNLAKQWHWNKDKTHLTLVLRKGLRWSDGTPMTSRDFHFMHYHLWRNSEFIPFPPPPLGETEVVIVDEQTFRWEFPQPYPLFENLLAQNGAQYFAPAHFYERYHPRFTNAEELRERVTSEGFISWNALIYAKLRSRNVSGPFPPSMRSHFITRRTPTQISLERNPYYHKLDPAGQQLPYIDFVRAEVTDNVELATAKAATGQKDFAAYVLRTQDFPLFKLGERTSGIRALEWQRLNGSDIIIRPNYNIKNTKLAALYWAHDFRRALSIAINRDEMNQVIYFGRGTPRQVTVIPSSQYYEPAFASANAEYDPEAAHTLLAGLGLKDIDGDGLREYPDGSKLTITLEFLELETPRSISLELLTAYWRAVGIDVRMKLIDRALHDQRARAGTMEMSVWTADRSTDLLFAAQPLWYLPLQIGWEGSQWNDWIRWYQSHGKAGTPPPPKIAQLHEWWNTMQQATDESVRIEMGKNILRSTAENIWSIGTVGLTPHPIVVNKRLRNVKETGLWGWDNRWGVPYAPATWFFAEGRRF